MKYKSITVIGIGTLGGFVADAIANLESVETLVLIDPDVVESKNLKNSIYRQVDVGASKVGSLMDIISKKNNEITIMTIYDEYVETKTKIPKCDLVLDCRDFTYNRRKEIDARLYISSRYLMVDCRKNVSYKIKTEGKYLTELTKDDLRYASSLVYMLISNNTIGTLMNKRAIQKYELDHVNKIDENSCDILYDQLENEEKFINLPDKIIPILEANKNHDLPIYIGSDTFPISKSLIPKDTLHSSNDLIMNLSQIVEKQCDFNTFVISLRSNNNRLFVELIPETGAA